MNKDLCLLTEKPGKLMQSFLEEYNNLFKIDIEYAKKIIKNGELFDELTEEWYRLLKEDRENIYTVYNHYYYFTDMFNCYKNYSRKYLRVLNSGKIDVLDNKTFVDYSKNDVKGILDIGCGCGFCCIHLKQLYKDASVNGVNIEDTYQYKFCKNISKTFNFNIFPSEKDIKEKIDLIFASDFFEHIEEPLDLLNDLINHFEPKFFVIANSFNTRSIGHFEEYKVNDEIIDQKKISRIFNKEMKKLGYEKIKTKYFNSRPDIYIKNDN